MAGAGGADIAPSTARIDFPGDFVWTNLDAIKDPISRNTGLPIQWTGGGAGLVTITGAGVNVSTSSSTVFICIAQASAGALTVTGRGPPQKPGILNHRPTPGAPGGLARPD